MSILANKCIGKRLLFSSVIINWHCGRILRDRETYIFLLFIKEVDQHEPVLSHIHRPC